MTVDLTVAVMTVPSRRPLLDRLLGALEPLDPMVVSDEAETGDVWEQYKRCLTEGRMGTHRLVVQDDALPVEGFADLALAQIAKFPTRIVCFYVPALPSHYGRMMLEAAARRASQTEIKIRGQFLPVVCTAWPANDANAVATWHRHASFRAGPKGRADDARCADWLRGAKRTAYASVPCLCDHDESAPSALNNGGRYSRRAAILPDTPPGQLTIA